MPAGKLDIPAKLQYPIKPVDMIPYKAIIPRGILLAFIPMTYLAGTKGIVLFHYKVSFS